MARETLDPEETLDAERLERECDEGWQQAMDALADYAADHDQWDEITA